MIIFRTYLRLIQKYAPIIVSYLAIFVVLAFIIGGGRETEDQDLYESAPLDLAIALDGSDNALADEFSVWLVGMGHRVSITSMTEMEAREAIFNEMFDAVFIFQEDLIPLAVIDWSSTSGYRARSFADTYFRYREAVGEENINALNALLDESVSVSLLKTAEKGGDRDTGVAFMSSLAYIVLLVSTTVVPLISQSFTEPALHARSQLSPYPARARTLEMLLGSALLVFGAAALLFLVTLPMILPLFQGAQLFRVGVNYVLFVGAVFGLTYVFCSFLRNRLAITAISTVLSLGMAFVSGAFVPQPMLGKTALALSKVFPLYYFIHANRFSASWEAMAPDLLIQLGFGLFFLFLALWISRLENRSRCSLFA